MFAMAQLLITVTIADLLYILNSFWNYYFQKYEGTKDPICNIYTKHGMSTLLLEDLNLFIPYEGKEFISPAPLVFSCVLSVEIQLYEGCEM